MKSIIHISDLQLPRIAEGRLEQLAVFIHAIHPDLVVITGDITQRARTGAFRQAQQFLADLEADFLAVPGNHDIPLFRVYRRIFSRFEVYKQYIAPNLNPHFSKAGVAIAGINTARALVFKGGRINLHQVNRACTFFNEKEYWFRIVATHHPLALPPHYKSGQIANGARTALRYLAACPVDLFLSGHYHVSTAMNKRIGAGEKVYSSVFIQAGTLSERLRGEPISFNVIHPTMATLKIETYHLTVAEIYLAQEHYFSKAKDGWQRKYPFSRDSKKT